MRKVMIVAVLVLGCGQDGAPGPAGSAGAAGVGSPGTSGMPGATGQIGSMGSPGSPGAIGSAGPRGSDGEAGAPGTNGPQGDGGPAGPAGPQGDAGRAGGGIVWRDGTGAVVRILRTSDDMRFLWYIDSGGYVWAYYAGSFYPTILNPAGTLYTTSDCTGVAYLSWAGGRGTVPSRTDGLIHGMGDGVAPLLLSSGSVRYEAASACITQAGAMFAVPVASTVIVTPPTTPFTPPVHPEFVP